MPIDAAVSSQIFHNLDNSNFATEGIDAKYKISNGSISGYIGIGTSFKDRSTGLIADVKGTVNYGSSPVSGGFRLRHNLNGNSQTVQFRAQPSTVTIPVGKNVNWYTTPYVAAKYDYKTTKIKADAGIFSGLSFNIGKSKAFVEGQLYDFTNINNSTTGINFGISVPL